MIKSFLSFLMACFLLPCVAQDQRRENPQAVLVVGKVLTSADSMLVRQLFMDGLHEKLKQNSLLAADYFKRVIDVDPANDAAMYELASMHYAKRQVQEAERQIRKAVTVRPDNKWYWLLLADIYKQTNNVSQLVPVLDELISLDPENENLYFDKASALIIQNKNGDANAVYNVIETKFGLSDELSEARQRGFIRQGQPEKAAAELENQIRENPDDLKSILNLADIYNRTGEPDKSLALLKRALTIDSGNVLVRLSLADTYRALKRYDQSFAELKQAFNNEGFDIDEKVRIVLSFFPEFADAKARQQAHDLAAIITTVHPQEPKAFALFGDVLFQEQKYDDAIQAYRQSIKLNDQVYQIWEQLIRIELSDSRFKEAIADGEAALAIFPNQAALYLLTSMAYAQTKNHEKAISYLNDAASLESEDQETLTQIYSGLGDSYHALKRYPDSDKAYDKSLAINPDNSYTLNNYAYYLALREENLEKAEKMSKRSIELDPGNSSSEDTYAWILFKLKKYREALSWIEKALAHTNNNSAVQLEHYGDILFHLGEKNKALQQWNKARTIGGASDKLEQKIHAKKYIE